ncbi:MAG: WG repeat-containing protein [Bacteroidia bacterium]|nr:WG repeat-containing protein [Bacteroidia bacterium]
MKLPGAPWVALALTLGALFGPSAQGQSLNAGYKALENRNYKTAFEAFNGRMAKEPVAARVGMATLCSTPDSSNSYFNLDTAFTNVLTAEALFCQFEQKERDALTKDGFTFEQILSLRDTVYNRAYWQAHHAHSVAALEHFLAFYPAYNKRREVELERNALAYAEAQATNTAAAYAAFLERYPTAREVGEARRLLDQAIYQETVAQGTLEAYLAFLEKYPRSSFSGSAQDSVYALEVTTRDEATLYGFTQKYPRNQNYSRAWRELYEMVCYDYQESTYLAFLKKYPTFPNKSRVYEDLELARLQVLETRKGIGYGFTSVQGATVLNPTFDSLRTFSENVVAVKGAEGWQYYTKAGRPAFAGNFLAALDFHGGLAGAQTETGWGLLTKRGTWALPPTHTAVLYLGQNRWAAQLDGTYHLLDAQGQPETAQGYQAIAPYVGKTAWVCQGGKFGLIDSAGAWVVAAQYDSLEAGHMWSGIVGAFADGKRHAVFTGGADEVAGPFDALVPIRPGLALARTGSTYGYLKADGTWLAKPTYTWNDTRAALFQRAPDGALGAIVTPTDTTLAVLDETGAVVQEGGHTALRLLQGKNVGFLKDGKWGVFDLKGRTVVPATYEALEPLDGPFVAIRAAGRWGAITAEGRLVVPIQYDSLRYLPGANVFVAHEADQLGLVSTKGQVLHEAVFDAAEAVLPEVVRVTALGKLAYLKVGLSAVTYIWKESGFPETATDR